MIGLSVANRICVDAMAIQKKKYESNAMNYEIVTGTIESIAKSQESIYYSFGMYINCKLCVVGCISIFTAIVFLSNFNNSILLLLGR